MDPALGDFVGDVLIEGEVILAVGKSIDAEVDEVVDARESIVMPGLIDSHIHLWQAAVRGVAAGCWGREYFGVVHPLSGRFRPEDMYASTYGGAVELLSRGVTTAFDFCHSTNSPEHARASLAALDKSGIRALFGYCFRDRPESTLPGYESLGDRVADLGALVQEWKGHGRIGLAVALNNIDHVSPQAHEQELIAARELGLISSLHSNLQEQVSQTASQGLLGSDILWVHAGAVSDSELALLAEQGGSIVYTPEIEAEQMAVTPVVNRALSHGIPVGLGSDVPAAMNGDLIVQLRMAYAMSRLLGGQTERAQGRSGGRTDWNPALSPAVLLRMATLGSAEILGLADVTGSLTPGKQADVVVISTGPFGLAGGQPIDHVIFQSSSRDIDSVFVSGRRVVRSGQLVDVDIEAMRRGLDTARDYVLGRSPDSEWSDLGEDARLRYEQGQGKAH